MPGLTAKECRKFIDAVVEKATAMGAPVSVAVVGLKNDTTDAAVKAHVKQLYAQAAITDRKL